MLVAAAVCPHPPLLVPELAAGAAHELDALRAACDAAVSVLGRSRPDEVVVVGADPDGAAHPAGSGASMRSYGADVRVGGPDGQLPLALAMGAWLLARTDQRWPVRYVGARPDAATQSCLALGRALAEEPRRIGLLVMGDCSARGSRQSPGRFDERAESFDAMVADALRSGDADALSRIEPDVADELMAEGRSAWQVLAGAAMSRTPVQATLLLAAAPYGVTYVVATWE